MGSQDYYEWTPFSSLNFRVVPLYMQTQKKKKSIISCRRQKKSLGRRVRET